MASTEVFFVHFADDTSVDVLKVRKVNLNISANGLSHHTGRYDLMLNPDAPKLVTRRGQAFSIDLYFNRAYSKDRDGVSFVFSIAGE